VERTLDRCESLVKIIPVGCVESALLPRVRCASEIALNTEYRRRIVVFADVTHRPEDACCTHPTECVDKRIGTYASVWQSDPGRMRDTTELLAVEVLKSVLAGRR